MKADSDLFLHWAAEEFVAAGRSDCLAKRRKHRSRAVFLAEICQAMRKARASCRSTEDQHAIGSALDRALSRTDLSICDNMDADQSAFLLRLR